MLRIISCLNYKLLDSFQLYFTRFIHAESGFRQIVTGQLDIWSEGAFYFKGTLSDIFH
jgi:hypothetical protein